MISDTRPMRPQKNRKQKPIPKVSFVDMEMCLNTSSWEPKQIDAMRPPAIIMISSAKNSSSVRPPVEILNYPAPVEEPIIKMSSFIFSGGKRVTRMTEDTRKNTERSLILPKLSLNMR